MRKLAIRAARALLAKRFNMKYRRSNLCSPLNSLRLAAALAMMPAESDDRRLARGYGQLFADIFSRTRLAIVAGLSLALLASFGFVPPGHGRLCSIGERYSLGG